MIDQMLIENNIQSLRDSFNTRKKVCDQLHIVQNVFTSEALSKLYCYILNEPDKPWQMETTSDYKVLDVPRKKISWHAESIIEEFHEIFSSLTDSITFAVKQDVKFHGIVLWKDQEGYEISWHTDNPILAATMQIYIAGTIYNPGTEFELKDGSYYTCDFKVNTGYFIDQTQHRLKHHTTGQVPNSTDRYSLFAMWT